MPSRKFHGKSRTGCACCKVRHVKCGEEKPICSNCARRQTQCVYPDFLATGVHALSEGSQVHSMITTPRSVATPVFDSLDLTLMHQYATSTALLLLPNQLAQEVWQIEVPGKAQDSVLLQHGILALAAMHLAREAACKHDPAGMARFRSRGLDHQQSALPLFRSLLEQDQEADQQVVFVFSVILVILAFASALSAETRPDLDEILDQFALFRGPRTFWRGHAGGLNNQWIEALFGPPTLHLRNKLPGEEMHFVELDKLAVDGACRDAVRSLKFSIRCFWTQPMSIKAAMWFPALDSDEYMSQVRARQPAALGIMKAYASNLKPFRRLWWVSEWSDILGGAVDREVANVSTLALADVGDLLACGSDACSHVAPPTRTGTATSQ